ncbi:LysR substrate-binding domain-containing protein [Saccharopolyspora rosea]|uniref:LysR substrate-binding domain-containing protein n=1 Tax=Saccharopolyspora rosea TaxID=524884 RepID=UPI0021D97C8C|nr:LysR substrate-binding domain-containing protein [Saccharopolyspora rosea]
MARPLTERESGSRRLPRPFREQVRRQALSFEPVLVSNYSGALQSFAQLRGGVTLVGPLTVRRRLDADHLAIVPVGNPELSRRSVQIQSMARRALPPAVRAFLAHLIEQIGDERPL